MAQRGLGFGQRPAASPSTPGPAPLLRTVLGEVLREHRQTQQRTLREVSTAARVSLGYLSEVERGQKEASSELLASICRALGVPLAIVLREVADVLTPASRVAPLPPVAQVVLPAPQAGPGVTARAA